MTGNGDGKGRTMVALAVVLEANGIEVCQHSEDALSMIVFRGDDTTGLMAVELAWAHDYHPQGLVRDWIIAGEEICEPDWTMLFD